MKRNRTYKPSFQSRLSVHGSNDADVNASSQAHEFANSDAHAAKPSTLGDTMHRVCRGIVSGAQHLAKMLLKHRSPRRSLALLEIQQLGDKRFVAIVRVGRQKYLIGGAPASVSLLAELQSPKTVVGPRKFTQELA